MGSGTTEGEIHSEGIDPSGAQVAQRAPRSSSWVMGPGEAGLHPASPAAGTLESLTKSYAALREILEVRTAKIGNNSN